MKTIARCLAAVSLALGIALAGASSRGQEPSQEPPKEDDSRVEQEKTAAATPPSPALEDAAPIEYYVPQAPAGSSGQASADKNPKAADSQDQAPTEEPLDEKGPEIPPSLPYSQWDMEIQAILGMSFLSSSGITLDVGASYELYVIDSLAPGVETWYEYNSDGPDALFLLPFLKWVFYRSWDFAPYVVAQGGRVFVFEGGTDAWAAGGGVGLVWFFSSHVGLSLELKVLELIYDQKVCFSIDDFGNCTDASKLDTWILPSVGIAVMF